MKTTAKVIEQKNDPSMEDILSSIREIISGEGESSHTVDSKSKEPMVQADKSVPEGDQEIGVPQDPDGEDDSGAKEDLLGKISGKAGRAKG